MGPGCKPLVCEPLSEFHSKPILCVPHIWWSSTSLQLWAWKPQKENVELFFILRTIWENTLNMKSNGRASVCRKSLTLCPLSRHTQTVHFSRSPSDKSYMSYKAACSWLKWQSSCLRKTINHVFSLNGVQSSVKGRGVGMKQCFTSYITVDHVPTNSQSPFSSNMTWGWWYQKDGIVIKIQSLLFQEKWIVIYGFSCHWYISNYYILIIIIIYIIINTWARV